MTPDSPHEHQFPEEQTPDGICILLPCLLCGLKAADAIGQLRDEREKFRAALSDIAYIGNAWLTPSGSAREAAMRQRAELMLGYPHTYKRGQCALSDAVTELMAATK